MNLKEKLIFLKSHHLEFNANLIDFFGNFDKIYAKIKEDYSRFNELLEIGKLNYTEFDLLKETIDNFKKDFEKLEKLIINNHEKMEILKKVREGAVGIIEKFELVKDVDTSWTGNYILDVKKENLYSINNDKLKHLLDSLESISSYEEKRERKEALPMILELFDKFIDVLGMFENEFILNVLYIRLTETMKKIGELTKQIDKVYTFHNKTSSEDFLKREINKCLANIDALERKHFPSGEQVYGKEKLVKLRDDYVPKRRAIALYDFRDQFKYRFKF